MTALKRMSCGRFEIESSVTAQSLESLGEKTVLPVEDVLSDSDKLVLEDCLYDKLINGIKIPCDKSGTYTVYCRGELFGIGHSVDGTLKIKSYLRD